MGRVLKAPAEHRLPNDIVAARTDAATILADAEARADALLRAAHERAGAIEAQAAADAVLWLRGFEARVTAELETVSAERHTTLARLAIAIAEKLVARAFAHDPTLVHDVVRDALAKLPRASRFHVRASPHDVDTLVQAFPTFSVSPDPSLAPGDAIVESDIGRVDARIPVRLHAIRRALGLP